jgi:Tfp pilus assembly PilM family ATPase
MAHPARIFALNLGMQTVSMAEFQELPAGGLKLVALKTSELIVDPAADATRNSQIESVAAELRAALKAPKNAKTHICLPSQSVFSRFVKLPGATANDVESIIGFEAQQNVPFPIDEVVWDYRSWAIAEARPGMSQLWLSRRISSTRSSKQWERETSLRDE